MYRINRSTARMLTEKYRTNWRWVARLACFVGNLREHDRRAVWWFEDDEDARAYGR